VYGSVLTVHLLQGDNVLAEGQGTQTFDFPLYGVQKVQELLLISTRLDVRQIESLKGLIGWELQARVAVLYKDLELRALSFLLMMNLLFKLI
jgi:hypothetical protein